MKNKRPRLQIIRGLPGSGKTSLALDRYSHLMRIETDMFFTRRGKYVFTLDLNKKAVKWFNKTVRDMAKTGMDFVVTGVFAAHTERLANTISTGIDYGYEVYLKTLTKNYGNIHDVPKEHLDAMRDGFISERELKRIYRDKEIHFGLMPRGFKV